MRYRYLDDFRRGISVFAIFSYGVAVLGTPQCPPPPLVCPMCSARHWFKITLEKPIMLNRIKGFPKVYKPRIYFLLVAMDIFIY